MLAFGNIAKCKVSASVLVEEYVVLGTHAEALADLSDVGSDVVIVHVGGAFSWWEETSQNRPTSDCKQSQIT